MAGGMSGGHRHLFEVRENSAFRLPRKSRGVRFALVRTKGNTLDFRFSESIGDRATIAAAAFPKLTRREFAGLDFAAQANLRLA